MPCYPGLLGGCSVLAASGAVENVPAGRAGRAKERGEVKGTNVALVLIRFGVHAVHGDDVEQRKDFV